MVEAKDRGGTFYTLRKEAIMVMTPEEKAARKRERMIEKTLEMSKGKYISKFVAPVFQRVIRAEAAARPAEITAAVVDGEVVHVYRQVGECVCVTCGKVQPWAGSGGGMNAGHFLASRRNSILFEESNVHPQCTRCNTYEDGNPVAYRLWMEEIHGSEEIDRLRRLKETSVNFEKDELVDMRIGFAARLKAAETAITNHEGEE